jgi:hypothetical protein
VLLATVGQHSLGWLLIRVCDQSIDIEKPLPFGAFLGQDVTRERVSSFDLSTGGQPKSLLRTFMSFEFWHDSSDSKDLFLLR